MRRLALALWASSVVLLATAVVFGIVDRKVDRGDEDSLVVGLLFSLESLAFASVGAIVAARRPHNPIGWMLAVFGLLGGVSGTADGYAEHALLADPGSLPGGEAVAWLADSIISSPALLFGFFGFLLLLFPHGRLPSPRWRPVVTVALPLLAVLQVLTAFQPGALPGFDSVENPFGWGVVESVHFLHPPLLFALFALIVASSVTLVRRFRRSRGEERQQLKWMVTAGAFLAAAIVSGPLWWSGVLSERVSDVAWSVLFAVSLASVPVACGIAILRYRLYDIDVVINRTLVYGSVTALLAGAYLGLVLVFQLAFSPVTEENSLAVALSTLAVAALFRPARSRVQALVDRRFYRRKYDAQRTLEGFAARLRDEIDLDALRAELTGVVAETMQPRHVSLWLKEAPE